MLSLNYKQFQSRDLINKDSLKLTKFNVKTVVQLSSTGDYYDIVVYHEYCSVYTVFNVMVSYDYLTNQHSWQSPCIVYYVFLFQETVWGLMEKSVWEILFFVGLLN